MYCVNMYRTIFKTRGTYLTSSQSLVASPMSSSPSLTYVVLLTYSVTLAFVGILMLKTCVCVLSIIHWFSVDYLWICVSTLRGLLVNFNHGLIMFSALCLKFSSAFVLAFIVLIKLKLGQLSSEWGDLFVWPADFPLAFWPLVMFDRPHTTSYFLFYMYAICVCMCCSLRCGISI